ncbi:hypothetical protein [Curtobacterium citreum]|uniref:hypothetical protein n=1 Tax=Curtobacterium citreum TaxID=2036 RepID=UPI000737301F|nr:hypothetical protein [Curtobacterium citreum]KTR19540.1 hypothetical protein NS330_07680 [Curtobacterium citreum]
MRQIGTVARATGLMWLSELAGAFDVSRRRVIVSAVTVGAGALALGTTLGITTISSLHGDIPKSVARLMIETATSGSLLSTALVAVILALTCPARSSLDHLLCLLPVTSSARSIGTSIPMTGIAAIGAVALSMPTVLLVFRILTAVESARFLLAFFIAMAVVLALAHSVLHVTARVCRGLLRMPGAVASSVSGAITIGAALATFGPGVISPLSLSGPGQSLTLARLTTDVAVAPESPLTWLSLVAVPAVAVAILWASARLPTVKTSPPGRALFPSNRLVGGASGTMIVHLLITIRAPQSFLAIAGALCLLFSAAWTFPSSLPTELRDSLAAAAPTAGCALILFAPGRVLPLNWLGPPLGRTRGWWVLPTSLAHAGTAAVVFTSLTGLAQALGIVRSEDVVSMAFRGALLFSAAAVAGVLVPWSDAQPLSGSVGLVVTTVITLTASTLILWLSETSEQLARLVSVVLTSLFLASSALTSQRLTRSR